MVMRISTSMMYDRGVNQLSTLQSNLLKTQLQLSTGLRVLTPADDPVASARALEVTQSQQLNEQFSFNRSNARSSLDQVDTVLQTVSDIYTDMQTTILAAGNAGLDQSNRDALAAELESNLANLLAQANTADGNGGYLFAGYKTNTQPFTLTETGAQYFGDQGQRELQVGSGRQLPISASGSKIFEQVMTGNGTFLTQADPGNVGRGGTGIISPGSVVDASKLTGDTYAVNFAPDAEGVMQYTVTNSAGDEVVPATPYKDGDPITFDGMTFDIKGTPVEGDSFSVAPSTKQSVFETVRNVIEALRNPPTAAGTAAGAALTNALSIATQNMQNAQDNSLSVLASVGAWGRELDYMDSSGSAADIQYQDQISNLIEVDPIAAASMFTQLTTNLQAAQQTFKAATSLSLFNYI